MTDIRVSGLEHITLDCIGAGAILLRSEHSADTLPDHPDVSDEQRGEFLQARLDDAIAAFGTADRVRRLCELAAAAGMWAEAQDASGSPSGGQDKTAPTWRPRTATSRGRPVNLTVNFDEED